MIDVRMVACRCKEMRQGNEKKKGALLSSGPVDKFEQRYLN